MSYVFVVQEKNINAAVEPYDKNKYSIAPNKAKLKQRIDTPVSYVCISNQAS